MRLPAPLREALRTFRRTPLLSALSVASIGFSLFTIGLFALVALNFRHSLRTLAERVEVVAFVLRGTPAETITAASQDVQAFPEVQEVRYVSEEEALARARIELVEFKEAYRDLEANPLPASLEVRLKPEFRDAAHAQLVAERLRAFPFVDDVRFGRDWVQRLDRLRNLAAVVGLVIGLAFAIVAIVIIGVTIRITVLQRATEISIMRLVGATNRYIREPFLLEGAIKGILGGLLAGVMCWLLFVIFRRNAAEVGSGLVFFGTPELGIGLLFGTLIGLLGSLLSVGRHLRHV
jgi:cell division transport system permease protein